MTDSKPELSRPLAIDRLGDAPVVQTITAEPAELRALARRLSLEALNGLQARVTARRQSHGRLIQVSGELTAEPVQICVVTLEPFANPVEDRFEITFTTEPGPATAEIDIDPERLDEPEPLEGSVLDLGELVVQFLSLALDPHPRKPGATLDHRADAPAETTENPFAALERLKRRG